MRLPSPSPFDLGYRWPAEWEPHEATWLSWPHNPDTWPGRPEAAEQAFVEMVRTLSPHEEVRINVADAAFEERVRQRLRAGGVDPERGVRFFHHATDDAWVRDHGPLFLVRDSDGSRAIVDFDFDAWGGKYPPWNRDDAVPSQTAAALGLPRFEAGFVLEPGSIEGDGAGTLLTSESCLLNPNRGPHGVAREREDLERALHALLAARHVVWLGDGIVGDDTDGHVDDLTRFVASGVLVTVVEPDGSDPNHVPLQENLERLRRARDAAGRAFEIVTLPMPPAVVEGGSRCPASYANFYIANGVVLVPVFDVASDARALAILRECLPEREIVGIPGRDLVVGLGAVHCLTQQEPRAGRAASR